MVKQCLLIPMVMALGASVAVTPPSDRRTTEVAGLEQEALIAMMPIDTCIRACLACDQGNVVSCAVCGLCSEPAIAQTNR
jgi:hypothetical protein